MQTKQCSDRVHSNSCKTMHCDVIMGIYVSPKHLPYYRMVVNIEAFDKIVFAEAISEHPCMYDLEN